MSSKHTKKLTGAQKRYLRGLGHHLKPLAMLGKEGITDTVLAAVDGVLKAHELVKVKIGNNCPLERREASTLLAQKNVASVVQVLGRTMLLYRENPDRKDDGKIILPRK